MEAGSNKVRLINDLSYRYKKTMYNLGFNIQKCVKLNNDYAKSTNSEGVKK